jgi:hypothetical protein
MDSDDLEVESAIALATEERILQSQSQISALESEALSLRVAKEALQTEKEKEKRALSSALARALSDAEIMQESATAERLRLRMELAAANDKIDALNTEHLKDMGKIRSSLQTETTRVSSLENEIRALQMERDALRISLSGLEEARKHDSDQHVKSTRSFEMEIASLKRRSLLFESESSSSKNRFADASSRLSALSVEFAIAKSEASSKEAALEADTRMLRSKVSLLESELEQVKSTSAHEVAALKKRTESAEIDLRDITSAKSALEVLLERRRQSEEEALGKARENEAELEALRASVLAPQPPSFDTHVLRSSLASNSHYGLASSRTLPSKLLSSISSSQVKSAQNMINVDKSHADDELNAINSVSDLASLQGECEGLRRALTELRSREASLTSQLNLSSSHANELHRKVASAEMRAREAESRITVLEDRIRSEHNDLQEVSKECAKLRDILEKKLDDLSRAQQALFAANDDIVTANNTAHYFKKKASAIKKKLIALFDLYRDLKAEVMDVREARDIARGAREADIERLKRELLHERSRVVVDQSSL